MKSKLSHPLCAATLRNGDPCQSVSVEQVDGLGMCSGHAKKARESAAAQADIAVRARSHRETSPGPTAAEKMGEALESPAEELPEEATTSTPIGSLRGGVREGLVTSETAVLIRDNIFAALSAIKKSWVSCPHCNKGHHVAVPDLNTRVNAANTLLDQLDGKLRAESATADQKLEALRQNAGKDLASCTDEELTLLMADTNDGEWPSAKEAAQKLARELLADRNTRKKPQHWLREKLTEPEFDLLGRIAFESQNGWAGFGDQIYELAALVVVDAEASA